MADKPLPPIRCQSCSATFSVKGCPQRWHRLRTHPTLSTFPFGSLAVTPAEFTPAELIERHADSNVCTYCHKHTTKKAHQ